MCLVEAGGIGDFFVGSGQMIWEGIGSIGNVLGNILDGIKDISLPSLPDIDLGDINIPSF